MYMWMCLRVCEREKNKMLFLLLKIRFTGTKVEVSKCYTHKRACARRTLSKLMTI